MQSIDKERDNLDQTSPQTGAVAGRHKTNRKVDSCPRPSAEVPYLSFAALCYAHPGIPPGSAGKSVLSAKKVQEAAKKWFNGVNYKTINH